MIQQHAIRLKACFQCGGEWDVEAAFRKRAQKPSILGLQDYHPRCIGCELTDRNDPTPEERARRKARNTLQHHAEKYRMKPLDFAKRYGWDTERMIYDVLHGHQNTCPYCWEQYALMGHGLDDVTLDIVDRDREPYYRINVKWCCQTCNREKATLSPEMWARRLAFWALYQPHREAIRQNPVHGLPLFAEGNWFPPLRAAAKAIRSEIKRGPPNA